MRYLTVSKSSLEDLASMAGASYELQGQSENSMDPIDKNDIQNSTLRFKPNNLAWVTDDSMYFNCVRFHSEDSIENHDEIEERRML